MNLEITLFLAQEVDARFRREKTLLRGLLLISKNITIFES
jgi:hypothetical protein